ncbi:glycosyltransferase [Ochrobactrum sp. MC-1LL]|uniref:glycosyltransferase n=1 Tax=Ochrobactrum sp. MC-1LL TaxID=2735351 RepID=UPI0014383D88|nr:glycosyltransferase [Ochrobactrum sp. MC-1LL]NKE77530.1 glycosyltransferase [Ochrobactrum sp. MC-1LL]
MLLTIKRFLRNSTNLRKAYREWRVEKAIRDSGKFDQTFYLSMNPDVQRAGKNAIRHYVRHGAIEGRNPNRDFNGHDYLAANPDVKLSGMNPFLHFIQYGEIEQRSLGVIQPTETLKPAVKSSLPILKSTSNRFVFTKKRYVAVFAAYNKDNRILPYVEYYISQLAKQATIIFVSDNYFGESEISKIKPYISAAICERHEEYDFGSYKRGIEYAEQSGILQNADGIILCNDSCIGPLHSLTQTLDEMTKKKVDFWGITYNKFIKPHLQSYFLFFNAAVFNDSTFRSFFSAIEKKNTVQEVILSYEVELTSCLQKAGFTWSSLITRNPPQKNPKQVRHEGPETYPLYTLKCGSPFVKRKALLRSHCNRDGIQRTIAAIKSKNYELYRICTKEREISRFLGSESVEFSLIMPTYNRKHCIAQAIDSVLQQTHPLFELIIVDDHSTDGTEQFVRQKYADEIATGHIRYLVNGHEKGVSGARNFGLKHAKYEWIGYIDSDNTIRPNFLTCFSQATLEYPAAKSFYAEFCRNQDGVVVGREFDANAITKGNFIDLGVFIHHRDCITNHGGFDTSLKRLVDWDLILRYTKGHPPVFIKSVLMDYDNDEDPNRISRRESELKARFAVVQKHSFRPIVTVAIPTYNQEKFIAETIESALCQEGNFEVEIVLADDGSTDNTQHIIDHFVRRFPFKVRSIGDGVNRGISSNFKRCFDSAHGSYIAILEGDDLWTDPLKVSKQIDFLESHPDCSMVFSKILVQNTANGSERILERQNSLASHLLTGEDFLADNSMNLIANFSCCMFRSELMKGLPDRLFEERFNEIALAFHLERIGPIGFINEVMGLYRQHPQGVWTGSDKRKQLESAINTRIMVKDVADQKYHDEIQKMIDLKKSELASLS